MALPLSLLALGGCAPTPAPAPIGAVSGSFRPDGDERHLWEEAAREEARLAGAAFPDAALDDYLARVAGRVVSPTARAAGAPEVRATVLRDPSLGAFSLPDGRVYLHSGLLARLESEGQLAWVLGHEVAHVTRRDALGAARASRAAPGGPVLPRLAPPEGFAPAVERAADHEALERMAAAGYDPREALRALERLRDDHGDSREMERGFWADRSRLDHRIADVRERLAAGAAPAGGMSRSPRDTAGRGEFGERTRVVVRENARLDMRAGRYHLAREALDRTLAAAPADPVARLYEGDLWRLQAQRASTPAAAPLLERAREAYERAVALDPSFADAYRQLGVLFYQEKDTARARDAFQRYLTLQPEGPDARRIREYLDALRAR